MWVFVITSFTRYSKVGREAQKKFESAVKKDGFHHLHANLYIRYCTTGSNAMIHKKRVKKLIPVNCCDVSIIMIPDSQEYNVYHSLKRKRTKKVLYGKPLMVEFL